MAIATVVKTIGASGVFATVQLWEDGAPVNLVTAERSAAGTFAVTTFQQGEALTFSISAATGKFLDTDSTGPGTGTYITYGVVTGDPGAGDVITGATSGATCVNTNAAATDVGIIWEGQCQNQEFSVAGTVLTITGSTTSTTTYKHLTTVSGASFRNHANVLTNPLRYNASVGAALRCTSAGGTCLSMAENNNRISNLQLKSDTGRALVVSGTVSFVDSCIVEGAVTSNSASNGTLLFSGNGTLRNSVVIQRGTGADHIIGTGTTSPNLYNCTIVAPVDLGDSPETIFLSGASGTVTVQNCALFVGNELKALHAGSATFNYTTCVSDIAGTANVTLANYEAEYEDSGNAATDLRPTIMSAQIDAGTTDTTNAATDIKGTARPQQSAYDIGCWESTFTTGSKLSASYLRSRRPRTHDAISKRKGQRYH